MGILMFTGSVISPAMVFFRTSAALLPTSRGSIRITLTESGSTPSGGAADNVEFAAWKPDATSAGSVLSGPCGFVSNQWYHIAITCQHISVGNNTIRIYVTPAPAPGVPVSAPVLMKETTGFADLPGTTGTTFKVGGGVTGGMAGRNFDGYIDEVRLSGVALTSFDSMQPGIMPRGTAAAWGATKQFTYDTTALPIQWEVTEDWSSNVGQIDVNTGLFTAIGPGTCKVKVTDSNWVTDETYTITVPAPLVAPDKATVSLGATQQFTFVSPATPVTWQVVNETNPGLIGTIDSSGLFTANGVGTCQIRATDALGNTDDSDTITVPAPVVAPDTGTLAPHGAQQFTFATPALPITWTVVNESTPGVGTIDSGGLFSVGVAGTCQIRATDALGNTDDSGTFTVANLTLKPATARVVRWRTAEFAAAPFAGAVTFSVINQSAGGVGSVDPITGVFTSMGSLGTCQVRAVDSMGNAAVSDVTVVDPGAYSLVADADTVVLYHLDEPANTISINGTPYDVWYDSVRYGLPLAQTIHLVGSRAATAKVSSVNGRFGNAVGEFNWTATANEPRWLWTGQLSPNPFANAAMTAECWVYFPPGVDIMAATSITSNPKMLRNIMGGRVGGNAWSLVAGTWAGTPTTGVAGGITFVYWAVPGTGSNQFIGSTQRVFHNDIWYHVAATYGPLGTTPETYEVKIYVTPQGTTTPQLVVSSVSTSKMDTTASGLFVGNGDTNQTRKFCGYIDEIRVSKKVRTLDELSWSLGGIASTPCTIGQAKKDVADGTVVSLTGTVSAGFADCRYLEDVNRSAGIRLDTKDLMGLVVGDVVTVTGRMATANNERCLQPLHVDKTAALVPALGPLGTRNSSLGGGAFGLQPGATGGAGLNSFGQLVRVWGKFVASGTDSRGAYFQIDDGSMVPGADGSVGVRVYYSGTVNPSGRSVAVTGVLIPVTDASSNIVRGLLPTAEIQLTD